jgi:Rieske Fe-S protein
MSTPRPPTRRRFLISTSTAALATTAVGSSLPGCSGSGGRSDAGGGNGTCANNICNTGKTVADLPVGSAYSDMDNGYIIAHDAMGFYAFTNICTHMGCVVPEPDSAGVIRCPCHMSNYNANGDLTLPAPGSVNQRNLDHYAVTFMGTGATAQIVVNVGMPLANRNTRTPAP